MSGEDYIFFLGWGSIKRTYQKLVQTTPKNSTVYLLSCPDQMKNTSLVEFEQIVLDFLEQNKLKKVNLIGHSMGGALALYFAYHHSERVKHLYLINSEGVYDNESFVKMTWNFLRSHTTFFLSDIPLLILALLATARRPFWNMKMSYFAHHIDLQQEAKGLKVPTTLLWGEEDKVIPLWQAKKFHSLIRDSKLITLPNMNHDWILKYPEKFWVNVRTF